MIDYGDLPARLRATTRRTPATIGREATKILKSGAFLLSMGGDHFVTWPLLRRMPPSLTSSPSSSFDAHQDTWPDRWQRIDHGSFVGRAVPRRRHRSRPLDPDRHRTHARGGLRHPLALAERGRGDACGRDRQDDPRPYLATAPATSPSTFDCLDLCLRAGHRHAGWPAVLPRRRCWASCVRWAA